MRKTNFLLVYFIFIVSTKLEKYTSNISDLVPPSVKNYKNSTFRVEMVATHVMLWLSILSFSRTQEFPNKLYPFLLRALVPKPTSSNTKNSHVSSSKKAKKVYIKAILFKVLLLEPSFWDLY